MLLRLLLPAREETPTLAAPSLPDRSAAPDTTGVSGAPAPPPAPRTVISRSGITLRLVERPKLEALQRPLASAYTALESGARAGDPVAQYQLGLLLYACRDVPADARALEHAVDMLHQTHRSGQWDVDNPTDEERSLRRRYDECAGVPGDARGQYRDWLRSAADAGLIEAQLDLPRHLPPGEYCQFLEECTPRQRAAQLALQEEAVDYMTRAREAGSAMALWTFGAWYEQGEVLPRNDVEAYAHFLALDDIHAATGQSRRFDAMLASLRERLRPIDLETAKDRARELLTNPNCCVLTP